jgi:DNA-binding LytR/AlgR family response regulator
MKESDASNLYVLAVEDDPIYSASLELTLEDLGYNHYDVVDTAAAALKLFKERQPDILLADIDINGPMNGIEIVEIISAIRKIPVVYITAFTDTITFNTAKQTRPSAYIVKPYHATNLQAAIELALQQRQNEEEQKAAIGKQNDVFLISDVLFIKYNSKLYKICIADILYIEVDEKYCYVTTAAKRFAVNKRLKNLMDQLPVNNFIQIHRSCLIKIDAIDEVNLEDSILKINGKELPIGKTYKDAFLAKLNLL